MKKGKLQIKTDSVNNHRVECRLNNGTIWMDRNELCELFGCYMKDIDESLEAIFRKKMFKVEDTCRYHIIAGGKRISYDISDVNLAVIMALAFTMTTPEAGTLRTWFMEQFTRNKSLGIVGEKFLLN